MFGNKWIYLLSAILWIATASGQDVVFKVEVSADTLYLGNFLGIKYTLENTQGDFQAPEFEGFRIADGPNVSSQFSMINGHVSQSSSYEYILKPSEPGVYLIPGAVLVQGDQELFSPEKIISVVDNPLGIQQDYRIYKEGDSGLNFPKKKPMTAQDSLRLKLRKIKSKKI